MTFGQQLKIWRKAKGLTQEELAAASGIKSAYMSNLERGFSTGKKETPMPSENLVERMAKVLDVDIDEMRLAAGYAPRKLSQVPKPILEALAYEGKLSENDEVFIAGIIKMRKEQNLKTNE